jgi:hypothetical protein
MTRESGPKAAPQISTPISIHGNPTAVARLEAAQAGLCAGVLDPHWDPEFTVEAAIVLIDAAIHDLAVV